MHTSEGRPHSRAGWSVCVLGLAASVGCSQSSNMNMNPANAGGSGPGLAGSQATSGSGGATSSAGMSGAAVAGAPGSAGHAGSQQMVAGSGGASAASGSGGAPAAGSSGAGGGGGAAGAAGQAPEPCNMDLMPMPGADPCTAKLKPNDDRLCEFSYNGAMRRYYIYAPSSYDPCQPASMILDMHGASESIEVHVGKEGFRTDSPLGYGSSWRRAVQGDNAVVVTPEGVGLYWNRTSDAAFLNTVADRVEDIADIHPERRYLTGISMGGMITIETGCDDAMRWRGLVPVAMLSNTCASLARPTPAMFFHAMSDAITSYPDSRALAADMAELNNCKNGPAANAMVFGGPSSSMDPVCFAMPPMLGSPDAADPTTVPLAACPMSAPVTTCERWDQCDEGVEVVYCTVDADSQQYGGHLLYNNDTGLNLPALAWPFLKKFQK